MNVAVVLIVVAQWITMSRPMMYVSRPHSVTPTRPDAAAAAPPRVSILRLHAPSPVNPATNLTTRRVSCPLYSGPGYDAKRHASQDVDLPEFEAPFASTPRPPTLAIEAVPLSDVTLLPGTPFHAAFETNLQYLKLLSTDSLLLAWRLTANGGRWKPGSMRLMGWEHTGSELRGHFLGHWLSASAMAFAATRDAELGQRMAEVIDELAKVAAAHGTGYVSAFPPSFLDRLEAISPVWAPYYTLHKLLAGLLHQYTLAGSATALRLAEQLAGYIGGRVRKLSADKGLAHQFRTLNQECGGINEALWSLAALTANPEHRATASLFDKPCLLGPLAQGKDALTGMHGNTALALMLGAQKRYEVTGEAHFAALTTRFYELVVGSRTYATGGSTHNELWETPGHLGHTLGGRSGLRHEHAESCTTHNMVRLVGMLLRASGGALVYAAFIERALLNGVLGTQRGAEPGAMLYFMPLGTGVSKRKPQAWRHSGWSTPFGDFWCCQGTGIEAFARLAEHVFMVGAHTPRGEEEPHTHTHVVYVLQLIAATLRWRRAGLTLTLATQPPGTHHPSSPTKLRLTIDKVATAAAAAGGVRAAIVVRVPEWASAPTAALWHADADADAADAVDAARAPRREAPGGGGGGVGGGREEGLGSEVLGAVEAGTLLRVERVWREGDVLELSLPTALRTSRLPDSRPKFSAMHALMHGPVVLACIGCLAPQLPGVTPEQLLAMLEPVPLAASAQLRTLRRVEERGAPAGTLVIHAGRLWVREGRFPALPASRLGRGGTDLATIATFLISGAIGGGDNLVSFEAFSRPGCYLAAPTGGGGSSGGSSGGSGGGGQIELLCLGPGAQPTAAEAKRAAWRRHDPLLQVLHPLPSAALVLALL